MVWPCQRRVLCAHSCSPRCVWLSASHPIGRSSSVRRHHARKTLPGRRRAGDQRRAAGSLHARAPSVARRAVPHPCPAHPCSCCSRPQGRSRRPSTDAGPRPDRARHDGTRVVGARAAQASPAASAAVRTSRTDLSVPPPTVCELFAVCALWQCLPGASWPEMVNFQTCFCAKGGRQQKVMASLEPPI